MVTRIRAGRVTSALANIATWRSQAHSQGATHLLPLLALLERGAGNPAGQPIIFNETPDEFAFWDRYFRLDDGNRAKPYFNPVTLRRSEAGFPHSNAATIRKNTFAGKWRAAAWRKTQAGEEWTLSHNYAAVFRTKALTKGGQVSRVPVIDLAVLFFRDQDFPDDADAYTLRDHFLNTFQIDTNNFDSLFNFRPELSENLYTSTSEHQDYDAAILTALVDDVTDAHQLAEDAVGKLIIDLNDPILVQVQQLLTLGTSGIIFSGVPGTGKSFYAKLIAQHLVRDYNADVFKVQFHPSYAYEDFIEGYRPDDTTPSGFRIVDKTFIIACDRARLLEPDGHLCVLIIDEINRGDPARIFGELLTYVERAYRGEAFRLPFTGRQFSVPRNLIVLGTMNPHDRSIAQLDAAFVRRFDHIAISPSREVVEMLLEQSDGFSTEAVDLIGAWFEGAQRLLPNGVGHSYFADLTGVEHLKLIWKYRIGVVARQEADMGDGDYENLIRSFEALSRRLDGLLDDD